MAKKLFAKPYDMPEHPQRGNSGDMITEQAGYISPQQQIEGMIAQGVRLEHFRKGLMYEFDVDDVIDDDYVDITRTPGFDAADASQLQNSLRAKAQAAENARRRQADEKKKLGEEEAKKAQAARAAAREAALDEMIQAKQKPVKNDV